MSVKVIGSIAVTLSGDGHPTPPSRTAEVVPIQYP